MSVPLRGKMDCPARLGGESGNRLLAEKVEERGEQGVRRNAVSQDRGHATCSCLMELDAMNECHARRLESVREPPQQRSSFQPKWFMQADFVSPHTALLTALI